VCEYSSWLIVTVVCLLIGKKLLYYILQSDVLKFFLNKSSAKINVLRNKMPISDVEYSVDTTSYCLSKETRLFYHKGQIIRFSKTNLLFINHSTSYQLVMLGRSRYQALCCVPVLPLTEHHAMKAYWGSGSTAPPIL
jgi:hypothetical protein